MTLTPARIVALAEQMRSRDSERNAAQEDVLAIREGRWQDVAGAGGMFPTDWPKGIVSNMIDVAAKDFADNLGPLPTFDARSAKTDSDRAKKFSDKRAKVLNYYIKCSNLQSQMYGGGDRLMTYGFMAFVVEPDYKAQMPKIRVDNNFRAHYQLDRWGRETQYYCRIFQRSIHQLCAEFPEAKNQLLGLKAYPEAQDRPIDLVLWYDKSGNSLVTMEGGIRLSFVPHSLGRCAVRVVEMPKLGNTVRGSYDDAIPVQLARGLMQVYALQAMDESVNAPMVVPDDVQEVAFGPKEIIRTQTPAGVGKVQLNIPQGLFAEIQNLSNEQRIATRYPEGRSGSIDASIITGQGVEALMGTFSTVIKTAQMMLAQGLEDVGSMCLELDQLEWPEVKKTVRGNDFGSPYEITYIPSRDIKGDFSCEVTYGLTAGLDPNRALVFLLQAQSAGAISLDTLMRQLPVELNVEDEKKQLDLELTRAALMQAIGGYAQAIPMMATQGMDPSEPVRQITEVLRLRMKGEAIEEAVAAVFAPPPPPAPVEGAAEPGLPGAESPAGGVFDQATGLPPGIAEGQAGMGAGGAQDLIMALAGTTPSGNPNLALTTSRRMPAA